ncbi:hypothetical protein U1Q18_009442 [Sarracenia purpurea var. burkii]
MEVKKAGSTDFVLGNSKANDADLAVDPHVLPATAVYSDGAMKILQYINSTKEPKAYIYWAKTVLPSKPAPVMAAFSSTGPNMITPNPDITAPGLNILAAWSEESSSTRSADDHRIVKYNIFSGTSMSCPHVVAAAALPKAIHPTWSNAAIRSTLITSGTILHYFFFYRGLQGQRGGEGRGRGKGVRGLDPSTSWIRNFAIDALAT